MVYKSIFKTGIKGKQANEKPKKKNSMHMNEQQNRTTHASTILTHTHMRREEQNLNYH